MYNGLCFDVVCMLNVVLTRWFGQVHFATVNPSDPWHTAANLQQHQQQQLQQQPFYYATPHPAAQQMWHTPPAARMARPTQVFV